MKIISAFDCNLQSLANELRNGATIVYPSETSYGLGCDVANASAVQKIFEIKKRTKEKSVIMIGDSVEKLEKYAEVTPFARRIAEKYWPGPLTVVLPAKNNCDLPLGVVNKDGTIAFRVTSQKLAADLSRELGRPLVSTSANIAGGDNTYDLSSVLAAFGEAAIKPDIVIDAGTLKEEKPSTVVKIMGTSWQVVRQGAVKFQI
jgi:L-threonylcarbamoyladenylate synthase